MNVLIVGAGSGSWAMRGAQLGNAIGARVVSQPTSADWRWADLAVLVKRWAAYVAPAAHAAGVPIVWDALDFWAQPHDNGSTADKARALLAAQLARIRPVLMIGATEAMVVDAKAAGYEAAVLPHHSWRGLTPSRVSPEARCLAYQGDPKYLGAWLPAMTQACATRKWKLSINPAGAELARADLIVALREGIWDGWICREWKSGVKLGNAVAAGRPVLTQDTAAMRDIGGPGSVLQSPADLDAAIDHWTPLAAREAALEQCRALAPAYTLPAVADQFRALLSTVRLPCPA